LVYAKSEQIIFLFIQLLKQTNMKQAGRWPGLTLLHA